MKIKHLTIEIFRAIERLDMDCSNSVKMRELAQPMLKNQFGQYLLKVRS